jgi:hypothetical protein
MFRQPQIERPAAGAFREWARKKLVGGKHPRRVASQRPVWWDKLPHQDAPGAATPDAAEPVRPTPEAWDSIPSRSMGPRFRSWSNLEPLIES